MGPNTDIAGRLRDGIEPLTMSDKVSQAHDIRYALSKNRKDIRKADKKMVSTLKSRKKEDYWINRKMGQYGIQAKMTFEKLGGNTDSISSFGSTPDKDLPLLQGKLTELEQQGFGTTKKKVSRWQRHVQLERVNNPTLNFKEVLRHASTTYRK
jgi:hypothetical protein